MAHPILSGNPVPRGYDDSLMSEADWIARGHQQAMAMSNGLDWTNSSADADGDETGGCLNGDYSDDYHDALNRRLDEDEYYEARADADIRKLGRMR